MGTQPNRFSKRDLEIVGSSLGGTYTVTVHQIYKGLWSISVQFVGMDEVHFIKTARGDQKVWRNIASAISYAEETCKFATEVFVEIGGWKLRCTNM